MLHSPDYTNLELSKKLKELGVRQESNYYWAWLHDLDDWFLGEGNDVCGECYSAFSVADLERMLPLDVKLTRLKAEGLYGDGWKGNWENSTVSDELLVDTMAKLLIQVIELCRERSLKQSEPKNFYQLTQKHCLERAIGEIK